MEKYDNIYHCNVIYCNVLKWQSFVYLANYCDVLQNTVFSSIFTLMYFQMYYFSLNGINAVLGLGPVEGTVIEMQGLQCTKSASFSSS